METMATVAGIAAGAFSVIVTGCLTVIIVASTIGLLAAGWTVAASEIQWRKTEKPEAK